MAGDCHINSFISYCRSSGKLKSPRIPYSSCVYLEGTSSHVEGARYLSLSGDSLTLPFCFQFLLQHPWAHHMVIAPLLRILHSITYIKTVTSSRPTYEEGRHFIVHIPSSEPTGTFIRTRAPKRRTYGVAYLVLNISQSPPYPCIPATHGCHHEAHPSRYPFAPSGDHPRG